MSVSVRIYSGGWMVAVRIGVGGSMDGGIWFLRLGRLVDCGSGWMGSGLCPCLGRLGKLRGSNLPRRKGDALLGVDGEHHTGLGSGLGFREAFSHADTTVDIPASSTLGERMFMIVCMTGGAWIWMHLDGALGLDSLDLRLLLAKWDFKYDFGLVLNSRVSDLVHD